MLIQTLYSVCFMCKTRGLCVMSSGNALCNMCTNKVEFSAAH